MSSRPAAHPGSPKPGTGRLVRLVICLVLATLAVAVFYASLQLENREQLSSSPWFWIGLGGTAFGTFLAAYWAWRLDTGATVDLDTQGHRQRLIADVHAQWIEANLYAASSLSIIAGSSIPLSLTTAPRLVRPLVEKRLGDLSSRQLSPGTPISTVFREQASALLILGAPGAGKTTLMLTLVQELLVQARDNNQIPIPVVFSLATWTGRRRPLVPWLAEQLVRDYQLPRKLARTWIDSGTIMLCLDRLDEVRKEHRDGCVQAINQYRQEHRAVPIVVCCRTEEYDKEISSRLVLNGAVAIQPLEVARVRSFLRHASGGLSTVAAVFDRDPRIQQLLRSPLLVNIAALTYRDRPDEEVRLGGPIDEQRDRLFGDYVQQALTHWAARSRYRPAEELQWLHWLASSMVRRGQRVLHPLWIQPDWVEPAARASTVIAGAAIAAGTAGALLSGLLGGVLANLPYEVPIDLPRSVLYPLSVIYIAGSAAAAGYDRAIAPPVRITWTAARLGKDLSRGLLIALLGGLPSGLFFGYLRGWPNGLIGGLMFGLILAFLILLQYRLRVLRRHESIDGTSLSALQVALVSSRFGIPFGLVVGATYGVVAALHFGWPIGLGQGTIIAFAFSIFSGLYLWLAIGGRAYLQHAVLRALLVRQGVLPWRIRRFLDDMVRSTLLRRESGGYSFLHDLLLAHLATESAVISGVVP